MRNNPFYKNIEFYFSVGALIISGISLYVSFLSSPLSDISKPKVIFSSAILFDKSSKDSVISTKMVGMVNNDSNNSAENVIITILNVSRDTPILLIPDGIEYSIIKNTSFTSIVKLPFLPPHYMFSLILEAKMDSLWIKKNPSPNTLPGISSVVYKNGIGLNVKI